jgi:PAS domain S-box-containing protein
VRINLADPNTGRIFNLHFSPIRDEEGVVQRVLVAGMDITDRHNHLEEIKLRETQYRSVFETVREGLVVLSRLGRILDANPTACELFRLPLERLVGQRMLPFVHPDDHEFLRDCEEGLRDNRSVQGLITALRTEGGSFDAAIIVTPFRAVGDANALAVIRDVTEERAAERALQRMNPASKRLSLSEPSHSNNPAIG